MELVAIMSMDYDLDYLEHFLLHYIHQDIEKYHFILHSKQDFQFEHVEGRVKNMVGNRMGTIDKWVGPFSDKEKVKRQDALRNPEQWVLFPDSDEFYEFGDRPNNLLEYKHKEHPDGSSHLLYGYLVDRMADWTRLPKTIDAHENIFEQYPFSCPMLATSPGVPHKVVAIKGKYRYISPHTGFATPTIYRADKCEFVKIDHFRWTTERIPKLWDRSQWSIGELRVETLDEIELFIRED